LATSPAKSCVAALQMPPSQNDFNVAGISCNTFRSNASVEVGKTT
jgi:hypothetical protein